MLLGHVVPVHPTIPAKTVLPLFCSEGAYVSDWRNGAWGESSRRSCRRNASRHISLRRHRLPAFDPLNPNANERPAVRGADRGAPVRASRGSHYRLFATRHTVHGPNSCTEQSDNIWPFCRAFAGLAVRLRVPRAVGYRYLTLRFSADDFPRLLTISNSTCWPSLRVARPAFSTAEI